MRHLEPKVEQLETDVDVVGDDFSQLTDKVHGENFPQLIKLKQKILNEQFICIH